MNLFVSFGFRDRLGFPGSARGGITSSCISSLMICGSRRVSVGLGGPGESDWADAGRRGSSSRFISTLISGSTSSSSMIIVGSLGPALTGGGGGVVEGCFWDATRRVQYRSRTAGGLALNENARSLTPVIGERYSSHPNRSRVCERDRGGEVPLVILLPFPEASPENPVRSTTSSVGVVAAGEADLEGAALRLDCGMFTSSSEDMIYPVRGIVFRGPSGDRRSGHEPTTMV